MGIHLNNQTAWLRVGEKGKMILSVVENVSGTGSSLPLQGKSIEKIGLVLESSSTSGIDLSILHFSWNFP